MIKKEVALEMSKKTDLSKEQAEAAINAFTDVLKESLTAKKAVFIRGFGTFANVTRKEKVVRNISKGESFVLPEHGYPSFKPAKVFKELVK